MAQVNFPLNHSTGKLEEFISKLQSVGTPEKMTTDYPRSLGFGSSHARSFPTVLKQAGLLDSSAQPNEVYKKGLRGGPAGRVLVGRAITQAYKPMFDVYPDAQNQTDADLQTFIKSNSSLDDEKAALTVRTFKVLCKFGDFDSSPPSAAPKDTDEGQASTENLEDSRKPERTGSSGAVTINVNIALSVDATSDPAVYDAFFSAMAKHLKGLSYGGA